MPKRTATAGRRAREIERTRHDIVEAAARVFAEAGFHAATMQAIAREAGFTAASLYTYFKSKDEIHAALLCEVKRALLASFEEPVPAGLTFPQQLELLLHRQVTLVAARRHTLRIAFDVGPRRPPPDGGPMDYIRRMARFLAESAPAGTLRCSPDEGSRLLFGLMQATFIPWLLGEVEIESIPRQAARIVDLFLHGAAAPPRG